MSYKKLKTYEIHFTGRRVTEQGVFYEIFASRFAYTEDEAIKALYDEFEHIHQPVAKEVPSPFTSEGLENLIRNDSDLMARLDAAKERLMSIVNLAALRQAKANAQWMDDPDYENRALYHAPAEQQFPEHIRVKAAAELVLYCLMETEAGQSIFNQLLLPEETK